MAKKMSTARQIILVLREGLKVLQPQPRRIGNAATLSPKNWYNLEEGRSKIPIWFGWFIL